MPLYAPIWGGVGTSCIGPAGVRCTPELIDSEEGDPLGINDALESPRKEIIRQLADIDPDLVEGEDMSRYSTEHLSETLNNAQSIVSSVKKAMEGIA